MIEDIKIIENKERKYIDTKLVLFKKNNEEMSWEIMSSEDSVAILIYNKDKDSFVFVRQFRLPVYLKDKSLSTLELCAGLVDKEGCSLKQITKEEVLEECGYEVSLKNIEFVYTFSAAPGKSGNYQYNYYVEVSDKDKKTKGGGIHDEDIEVVYVPINKVYDYISKEKHPITASMLFMINWFFHNKK